MNFKQDRTTRGFDRIQFADAYDDACVIQKSSLATDQAIWFGIQDANPHIMASKTPEGGVGWVPYAIPADVKLTTRMHLTQAQVKKLLPILQGFADHGELPQNLDGLSTNKTIHDRLTRIKTTHEKANELYALNGGGTDNDITELLKQLFLDEDTDWLIHQAERVGQLEKEKADLLLELDKERNHET